MFRSKRDVDRHVSDILSKINNENERNLRGYNFARLYFQVKDYETAKRYLAGFLSVRDHHAPSHKLMAQIFEGTGNIERALQSYKRSLEIDPNQKDIVLKICELYCQLPVDHETARYWADRADQLFSHNEIVFRLRECLVTAEGEPNRTELENLIATELLARPNDLSLRIKLLRLYLDTERIKEAYVHALKIESKKLYPVNTDWYYCLIDIFEAYQEEVDQELDSDFYIHFLTALDNLISLTLAESHALGYGCEKISKHSCSINDAASSLHMFDQQLGKASKITLRDGSWSYFLHHMKGQLYLQMGTIIMKRAKKDQGNWKEACRVGAALFLIGYTFKPSNLLQEVWFTKMDEKQKIFTHFFQQGALRTSYTGHVIMSLCKEDKSKWLQKIKQDVCLPQVRERTYQRLFSNISQKQSASTSYFLQDATFVESSLEFPSLIALQEYDKAAFKLRPDSLHHLVWLLLHQMNHEVESGHQSLYQIFEGLQYSNNNLSKGSPESLCQLDIEAFLQATVYTTNMYLEHRCITVNPRSGDTPLSVPPDIAEPLCTKDQSLWWSATYGLVTSSVKEKLGEQRRILQRGLEVIRGIGNHGLDVKLVVHLAHIFANSAQSTTSTSIVKDDNENGKVQSEEVKCLEFRAAHYWNVALGMLEKLGCNQTIKVPKERMFDNYIKDLSSEEILALKEEGQLYLACRAMNAGKLEEAAAIFNNLSSPFASFYLALTLKESANQQMENKPIRDVSPKTWNTHVALLNKAKEALYLTMDRIKGDKNHPLNQTLFAEIERIEHEILENSNSSNIDYSGGSDEVDEYDVDNKSSSPQNSKGGTPSHMLYRLSHHSTPRPSASLMSPRTKNRNLNDRQYKHLQPSPERLDAQIRALSLTQDTLIKTLLEQQRTLLDTNKTIVEELKQNKEVVEQLKKQLEEFHIATVKTFNRRNTYKKSDGKGQGDYEEEDYHDYDGNGCLMDYYVDDNSQEIDYRRSYHYTHPHMATEASGTSTINYVPQPPPPQGPPPLNHYGYQYPPPPALAPVTPTQISERQQYFHSTLGPGLPFSEGQQLPQFHFHVASPASKPSVLGRLGPVPQQITPSTVASTVPQQSPQTSVMQPHVPWAKGGTVPHAFQIPLPPTATVMSPPSQPPSVLSTPSPFVPPTQHVSQQTLPTAFPTAGNSTTTTESQLKTLLSTPPSVNIPVFRQIPGSTSITPASKNTPSSTNVSPFGSSTLNRSLGTPTTGRTRQDSDIAESGGSEAESHDVEKEVMGDFKPVIPLPAEVVTATGEEEEKVIFEERAKLFRFVDREWKERGIGTVKLLLHEHAGKVRLLMRRDQVLKVCANHYIVPSMEIHPMTGTDRAWIWAAQDFADEEVKPERFCIKFKTSDIAITFKKAFDNAVALAKESEQKKSKGNESQLEQQQAVANSDLPSATTQKTTPVFGSKILPKFGSKFLPKPGSWSCSVCYVNNDADKTICAACESLKPGSHLEQQQAVTDSNLTPTASQKTVSFGFKFLPKSGSWSCSVCYVNNDADKTVCSTCESLKPGSHLEQQQSIRDSNLPSTISQKTVSSFGSKFLPKSGSWSCSVCYVNNDADKTVCIACESLKPGTQPQPSTRSPFTVNSNSTGFEICSFGGRSLTSQSPVSKINETRSTTDSESKTNGKPTEPSRPASVFLSLLADQHQHNIQEAQNKCKSSEQPKTMFGGFTFTSAPVVKESENPEAKDREILVVTTKAKNGPQVNKIEASKPSPFSGFSFKMFVSPTVSTSALSTSTSSATNVSSPDSVIIVHTEKKEQIKSDSEQPVFGTKSDVTNLQFTSLKTSSAGFQKDPSFKGFAGAGAPVFTTAKEDKRISESTGDGAPEEFEPTVEFKPVVPLPALIDVKTGEEDDEKLFGERAKLFRYDSEGKQWKERGIGELKILYQKSTEKYRILMRREQVHKLCANHNILPEMKPIPLSTSDRSWTWMAHDYSDGELKEEKFAVKFKTSDLAQQFLKVFEKCQVSQKQSVQNEQRKSTERITDPCINNKKTLSEIFKPELGSWECNVCLVRNEASKMVCCACETPKPGTETATSVKHTQQTASNSLSNFQFGIPSQISASKGTEASSTISTTHISSKPFVFDNSVPQPTTQLPGIIFGQTQPTGPTTYVFGQPPYANTAKTSLGFKPQSANNMSDSKVMFGSENIFSGAAVSTTNTSANSSSSLTVTPVTVPPAYVFGSLSSTNTNFGTTDQEQNQSSDIVQFRFGSPQKYEFNFSGVRPRSPTKTPKSPKSPGTPSDADGEEEEVEQSDVDSIYFQPVIPLPPKVDVKTGEEDEEVLFSKRAKLFRFVSGEWKERGVGDIKILHNLSQKTIRLLMRRDQVLKVCLNHYLGADIKFTSKGDKSFQWAATDFSENEPNPEQLAIRFKTAETALQFKEAVDFAMKKLGFSTDEPTDDKKESEVSVSDQQSSPALTPKFPPSFSFRLDGQKTNPPTNAGFSLALRFGATSLPTKSLFGNISLKCIPTSDTDANIAFTDSFATKADTDQDNDIEVIESKTVSLEKQQLAAKLRLPPNFYLYESKPPCSGCRGCEKEDLEKTSSDDLIVVYEVTPTKKQIEAAAKLLLPPTFYLYEDKPPCPGCRGCRDEIPSYTGCKDELKEESPSVASSDVSIPDIKCFMSNTTLSTFSFADLASKGSGFEVPAASTSRTKTVFAGAGTPVFGCMTQKQSEEEGDNDHVVPAPDIHFEPVVPLPEIVDVKTGEEDEAPIFCQRAKLYRYDGSTRQWKERGVGDFKILQHKEKCRFRLILRREQVHKVACNHYLTQNMEFTPLPTSENALCWNAIDFAEGQISTENFTVRFKNKDILQQFCKKVEECKKILSSQTSSKDSSPKQSSLPVVQMPTNSSPKQIPAVSQEFSIPKIATQVCDLAGKDTSNAVSTINHDQTLPSVDLPIAQDSNKSKQLSEQETAEEKQEEYEDEEDDDDMMMFEKRITLEIFDEKTHNYKGEGLGTLRVLYDDSVFGYHIQIVNDEEAIVCDHIIAIQTCLRIEKKCATWAAIDISIDPPKRRQFRAIFSSVDAAQEFNRIFEEGKQAAVQAEIVEKEDIAPTSPIRGGKTPDVSVASK